MQSEKPEVDRVREDVHFSFVEYGGAAVTHWSFLESPEPKSPKTIQVERLCAKLFLIADNWGSLPALRARRARAKKSLKHRFYELRCKEVENLLTPNVLVGTVERLTGINLQDVITDHESYVDKWLGTYLWKKMPLNSKPRRRLWETSRNSPIRNGSKLDFCIAACEQMKVPSDLSNEAQLIGKRLLAFVSALQPRSFKQSKKTVQKK